MNKFTALFCIIYFCLFNFNKADSGEITDMEWTALGAIRVFYYDPIIEPYKTIVECLAYRPDRKSPIGGGTGMGTGGGFAQIGVEVPKKYQMKSGTTMRCTVMH